MSTNKNRKPRKAETHKPDKHAKYKLALVPVLLCVLAYVLFSGSSDDAEPTATATATPASSTPANLAASRDDSETDSRTPANKQRSWPEVDLRFLAKPNPFRSYLEPEPAPPPAELLVSTAVEEEPNQEDIVERLQRSLDEQPIHYVFQSGSRKLVMLGEQLFEAGDAVFDVMRIQDIRDGHLEFTFTGPSGLLSEPAGSVQ